MKNNFKKNNFVVINNFIDETIINSHYMYMLDLYKNNKLQVDRNQVKGSLCNRNDIVFDTLLSKMRPLISEVVDKELWPTYAFCRLYREGQELKKHKDRQSCEYSVTLTLGCSSDKLWPIYLGNKNKISLNIGEALIYKGRQIEHWRKKLKGNHYIQLFLHYVDSDGPYKEFVFDKREGLNSLDYEVFSYNDVKFA
ncbi:MAG: hypothetical protein GWO78_07210 [Dehalococcoidales bacterium]|jgi:hypothetical protein|nr:hypothetical protein [Dehalococcoidales bacterium]